jgi:hypothetical protein
VAIPSAFVGAWVRSVSDLAPARLALGIGTTTFAFAGLWELLRASWPSGNLIPIVGRGIALARAVLLRLGLSRLA